MTGRSDKLRGYSKLSVVSSGSAAATAGASSALESGHLATRFIDASVITVFVGNLTPRPDYWRYFTPLAGKFCVKICNAGTARICLISQSRDRQAFVCDITPAESCGIRRRWARLDLREIPGEPGAAAD